MKDRVLKRVKRGEKRSLVEEDTYAVCVTRKKLPMMCAFPRLR